METNTLIKCSESVLNFLLKGDEEYEELNDFNTPSLQRMLGDLAVVGLDMSNFTIFLNDTLNILDEPLWGNSDRDFFSENGGDTSRLFYKKVIQKLSRKKKLNKIISNAKRS